MPDLSSENLFPIQLEEIAAPDPSGRYGEGGYWWPKSCQIYNPDPEQNPLHFLKFGPEGLFDRINFLCFFQKSWLVRIAIPYLQKACCKKISEKTIWNYLQLLRDTGLIALIETDEVDGNVYLVNPVMMRAEKAKELKHYHLARQKLRIKPPPKPVRKQRTRSENLAIVRAMKAAEAASKEAAVVTEPEPTPALELAP
jgi:hypothetical protein